jgi:hypothetical protein
MGVPPALPGRQQEFDISGGRRPRSIAAAPRAKDGKQQTRNRQIYHGLRCGSLHIVNKLIGQALEEAADPIALKVARRFGFRHREIIYRTGARSLRALQLGETFPVLALVIYCDDMPRENEQDNWRRESSTATL